MVNQPHMTLLVQPKTTCAVPRRKDRYPKRAQLFMDESEARYSLVQTDHCVRRLWLTPSRSEYRGVVSCPVSAGTSLMFLVLVAQSEPRRLGKRLGANYGHRGKAFRVLGQHRKGLGLKVTCVTSLWARVCKRCFDFLLEDYFHVVITSVFRFGIGENVLALKSALSLPRPVTSVDLISILCLRLRAPLLVSFF